MTEFYATALAGVRHVLAEGPLWLASSSTIMWVDVERGSVFEGRLTGDQLDYIRELKFDGRVGAAVPGVDGSLLVAVENRLVVVGSDGAVHDGPTLLAAGVASRANDGACDPRGRFLIGTLALDDRHGQELLYRLEPDATLTVIDSDLTLSNGLAWSPDGTLLYSTDTVPGIVWVRDYDPVSGVFGDRRQHLHFDTGYPDGICVDSLGHLWVAVWGECEVRSFGLDGTLEHTVFVDAPHVSSVAFVGEALDILLITTASRDLDEPDLRNYPDAGRLFVADVGVAGIPTSEWSGFSPAASY